MFFFRQLSLSAMIQIDLIQTSGKGLAPANWDPMSIDHALQTRRLLARLLVARLASRLFVAPLRPRRNDNDVEHQLLVQCRTKRYMFFFFVIFDKFFFEMIFYLFLLLFFLPSAAAFSCTRSVASSWRPQAIWRFASQLVFSVSHIIHCSSVQKKIYVM